MARIEPNTELYEYLRQIIYYPDTASLDREKLSEDEIKLADNMDLLLKFLQEGNAFCDDLAQGRIRDARIPSRANGLAGPLKAVHSMLLHLIWLMEEVTGGNYRQRLHFTSDVSAAFNNMVGYLVDLSYQDKLTGLLNADGFMEKGRAILASAAPSEHYFMVSANINDFKHFNALYGTDNGDTLLLHVADFLRDACHSGEICSRIQADHFMCLIRARDCDDAAVRMNVDSMKIQPRITYRTYLFRHGIYDITDRTIDIREICRFADFACASIRNRTDCNYAVYDADLAERYALENTILSHFQRAIDRGEFVLYYQPKVDVKSEKIMGCEALVRWNSPQGELVLPGNFIGLFEENGLISALDFYVVGQVCRMLRQRLDAGLPIVTVAVNFSRIHLRDIRFVYHLQRILKYYRIEPHWIEVELTETAFFESMHAMLIMIDQLHEAGFSVAMDDFGSGFSSLNFLKNIPVDVVKIDKLFFDSFATDRRVRLLIQDILSITKHLELKSVAEGIETQEQVKFLKEHGCDLIQGFYFHKPMTAAELGDILVSQAGK